MVKSDHWAFQPIQNPPPPQVKNAAWVRNDLDRFVLARLEKAGIAPSPEADRYTLIKRLSYDLLGLPPTPEETDAFVADSSEDAYAKLVDRLLESPHFGERWGRHWLDKARYADSDGYEKDRPRPNAWRYRDWVIEAINADMPFDQFTREQLAGDLLKDATPMQQLATAFHRQTLTNTEGGTDQEEFRVEAVVDRTNTTGTVWLGLTVGCARCHSHKYDPLTQAEFYQLFAFFNNADETNTSVPISEEAALRYETQKAIHDKLLDRAKSQARSPQGGTVEDPARMGSEAEKATRKRTQIRGGVSRTRSPRSQDAIGSQAGPAGRRLVSRHRQESRDRRLHDPRQSAGDRFDGRPAGCAGRQTPAGRRTRPGGAWELRAQRDSRVYGCVAKSAACETDGTHRGRSRLRPEWFRSQTGFEPQARSQKRLGGRPRNSASRIGPSSRPPNPWR